MFGLNPTFFFAMAFLTFIVETELTPLKSKKLSSKTKYLWAVWQKPTFPWGLVTLALFFSFFMTNGFTSEQRNLTRIKSLAEAKSPAWAAGGMCRSTSASLSDLCSMVQWENQFQKLPLKDAKKSRVWWRPFWMENQKRWLFPTLRTWQCVNRWQRTAVPLHRSHWGKKTGHWKRLQTARWRCENVDTACLFRKQPLFRKKSRNMLLLTRSIYLTMFQLSHGPAHIHHSGVNAMCDGWWSCSLPTFIIMSQPFVIIPRQIGFQKRMWFWVTSNFIQSPKMFFNNKNGFEWSPHNASPKGPSRQIMLKISGRINI